MLVPQTVSYFFSSDPDSGAQNVSADGSAFSVYLDRPLGLPTNAVGATLGVISATIWNNTFNISADIGNNVFQYYENALLYNHVIPDGQYTVTTLLNFFQLSLTADGFPADSISIAGDSSTQKVIVTAKTLFQLDMTVDLRFILGFNSQLVPAVPNFTNDTTVYADNVAEFNRVDLYQIKSDIVSGGIPVNNQNNNIIASVPITARSGSQIVYQPFNLTEVNASELIGYKKNTFRVELLDQLGRPTPTNGEIYTFVLRFKYFLKE
jgi:hypothetical protein